MSVLVKTIYIQLLNMYPIRPLFIKVRKTQSKLLYKVCIKTTLASP